MLASKEHHRPRNAFLIPSPVLESKAPPAPDMERPLYSSRIPVKWESGDWGWRVEIEGEVDTTGLEVLENALVNVVYQWWPMMVGANGENMHCHADYGKNNFECQKKKRRPTIQGLANQRTLLQIPNLFLTTMPTYQTLKTINLIVMYDYLWTLWILDRIPQPLTVLPHIVFCLDISTCLSK